MVEEWNLWGTTAPCVGWRSACAWRRVGGGRRGGRPAPRWVDVTKAYQTRSYGFVPPFYSPFGHDQAYNRISGQMSTKPTWRRLAPLVLGLGRRSPDPRTTLSNEPTLVRKRILLHAYVELNHPHHPHRRNRPHRPHHPLLSHLWPCRPSWQPIGPPSCCCCPGRRQ